MRLIDADALLESIWDAKAYADSFAYRMVAVSVANAPTIEAEPVRHGEWEHGKCKNCGFSVGCMIDGESELYTWVWNGGLDYCPDCGAKMDGGADHAGEGT